MTINTGWTPPITNREKAQNILARLKKVAPHDPRVAVVANFLDDDSDPLEPSDTFISNLDFVTREMEHAKASQPVDEDGQSTFIISGGEVLERPATVIPTADADAIPF